jgi:glutamyl-tRNA synthetase
MVESGIEPIALLAMLARIGTSLAVEPVADLQPLIGSFDFSTFGRAPARFDLAELEGLNARIIHQLPYEAVRKRLPEGMAGPAWEAIRPNLARVADAADWWQIVQGPIHAELAAEDRDFLVAAADEAERMDWAQSPWAVLVAALKASTGRSGKTLFLPLRRALTGRDSGPEMAALLPLIGRDEAVSRLRAAAA